MFYCLVCGPMYDPVITKSLVTFIAIAWMKYCSFNSGCAFDRFFLRRLDVEEYLCSFLGSQAGVAVAFLGYLLLVFFARFINFACSVGGALESSACTQLLGSDIFTSRRCVTSWNPSSRFSSGVKKVDYLNVLGGRGGPFYSSKSVPMVVLYNSVYSTPGAIITASLPLFTLICWLESILRMVSSDQFRCLSFTIHIIVYWRTKMCGYYILSQSQVV